MATFSNTSLSFVKRNPGATFLSLIILASGVFFSVRAPAANNTLIQKWEKPLKGGLNAESGSVVATMTSSGTLTLSGGVVTRGQSNMSGVILSNAPANQGVVCGQTGGQLKFCRSLPVVVNGISTCTCK